MLYITLHTGRVLGILDEPLAAGGNTAESSVQAKNRRRGLSEYGQSGVFVGRSGSGSSREREAH